MFLKYVIWTSITFYQTEQKAERTCILYICVLYVCYTCYVYPLHMCAVVLWQKYVFKIYCLNVNDILSNKTKNTT